LKLQNALLKPFPHPHSGRGSA